MADIRGIFKLSDVIEEKKIDNWSDTDEVWVTQGPVTTSVPSPNIGYYAGGVPWAPKTDVDRINYSTDTKTALPGSALSAGRYYFRATTSESAGYFTGGFDGTSSLSTVEKIVYATDVRSTITSLTADKTLHNATSSSTHGYLSGGLNFIDYSKETSFIKITLSSDTSSNAPSVNLPDGRGQQGAAGNATKAYYCGGTDSSYSFTTHTYKITYSTDTVATLPSSGALSETTADIAGTGSPTVGYFAGGNGSSKVEKITYSNDTRTIVPTRLTNYLQSAAAAGNSSSGYFAAGRLDGSPISSTTKVTYSTDTVAVVPGAALSAARYEHAATGSRTNGYPETTTTTVNPPEDAVASRLSDGLKETLKTGYFGGGIAPSPTNVTTKVDKVIFTTDTTASVPGAALAAARYSGGAVGSNTVGYFAGGANSTNSARLTTVDKITYSTDTRTTVPGAALSAARYYLAATGNSTAGYFGGGLSGSNFSTVDKLNYTTETTAALPSAPLSNARNALGATGSSTAGYFGGGNGPNTAMDKLTYSTDSIAYTPGANISPGRAHISATASETAGYFGGGDTELTTMSKLTFSVDTTATSPSVALKTGRGKLAATGSSTVGYFGGGETAPGAGLSSMDKVTYSTDTIAAAPGALLSTARRRFIGATSARANNLPSVTAPTPTPTATTSLVPSPVTNAGYFGGGKSPSTFYATMDKVNLTTDTTATVPGSLSGNRKNMSATGSSSVGYFTGGLDSGFNPLSTVDKLTYSADTTAAVPGAALSAARYNHGAVGSSTFGYFGGGTVDYAKVTSVERIAYSSDTRTTVSGAALSAARYGISATGNSTAGYFGGGYVGPATSSTVDKLTYSSETTAAVPGAALSQVSYALAATGNSTAGYFGGGKDSSTGARSTMDKLTYSTDTTAASPGAALSAVRYNLAATGNSTAGYFGGGETPYPGTTLSSMDKLTYSTDTTAASPGASLSSARAELSGTGPITNALPSTASISVPNIL